MPPPEAPRPASANFDPLTPLALLERTLRVFPEKTAVVYGERRLTWSDFATEVGRMAGALTRAGVEPGDRVAFLTPNVPELLLAHFAEWCFAESITLTVRQQISLPKHFGGS